MPDLVNKIEKSLMNQLPEKSIYIDVTSTINTLHTTGIQRVVQKFSTEFQGMGSDKVIFVKFFADGAYRKVNIDWQKKSNASKPSQVNKNIPFTALWIKFKEMIPGSAKRNFRRVLNITRRTMESLIGSIWHQKSIKVKEGDLFLMIDASWNYMPWAEIRRLRNEGAVISHVVYDLLPLKYPKLFTLELVEAFEIWSKMISYYCANLYCISYAVKKDVLQLLCPLAGNQFNLVEVIPLGNDIGPSAIKDKDSAPVNKPDHLRFLSVGTIEPRKNYQFTLNAFNELWAMPENEGLTWTVVGRVGWNSQKLYTELKNHPEFGRRLKLFVEADDKKLMALYEESNCVIAGSIDEGYGLPVVEAIEHGCTVLLSDIEIFREFNLLDTYYFSLDSTDDLIKKIQSQKDVVAALKVPDISCISWKNASDIFYEKLSS